MLSVNSFACYLKKKNRRGIPLRLNNDRYALLERQWLTHRLDFVRTQWNPHFGKY